MHDRVGTMSRDDEPGLAAALRALPQRAPEPDLWPGLARALHGGALGHDALNQRRPRARWRYRLPLALAAAVALALLLPRWSFEPQPAPILSAPTTSTPTSVVVHAAPDAASAPKADDHRAELDTLHQRSQSLERWIAAFSANAPQDSRNLMAAVEVEDLIGLVDVQLDAARGDGDALPLWRRRVALLQDLATIRGNAFAVAANDVGAVPPSQLLN